MTTTTICLSVPHELYPLLASAAAKRNTTVQAELLRLVGLQLRVSVPRPVRGRPRKKGATK